MAECKRLLQGKLQVFCSPAGLCWALIPEEGLCSQDPTFSRGMHGHLVGKEQANWEKTYPRCSHSISLLPSAQGFVCLVMFKDTLPVTGPVSLWTLVSFLNLQCVAAGSSAAWVRCWTPSFGFLWMHLTVPASRLPSCIGAGRKTIS